MWGSFELFFRLNKMFPKLTQIRAHEERTNFCWDGRTDERAKKNIIRRKEKERSEYYYEFVHGNSIVNNNNTDRGDDYILRGKVFQTLHVSSVLSAGGQVGFSELLGHCRLVF